MPGYYDYVLGFIPAAMFGITAALLVAGVDLTAAVPLASTVALGLMGHALFVNSPVAEGDDHAAGGVPAPNAD